MLMLSSIDKAFDFQSKVLALRGYRQQLLASNIANADTPHYKAMDIDFAKALQRVRSAVGTVALERTSPGHLAGSAAGPLVAVRPQYRSAVQPSVDGNTVDAHVEQAQFAENALQYMATLQFINSRIQGVKLALQGN